jgi:hypothetical protein
MVGMWFRSLCRRLLRFSSEREPSFKLDDLDWDSEFVRLGDEEWEKVVKPRAEALAARHAPIKEELPALREERRQAKARWEAIRRELREKDYEEYKRQKAALEKYLSDTRARQTWLKQEDAIIRAAWREHYDDVRERKWVIFESRLSAIEAATQAALATKRRRYFFLFPRERVTATADFTSQSRRFPEARVEAGSKGVVWGVESLRPGRYTFNILFCRGTDREVFIEYDPTLHGAVLEPEANPRVRGTTSKDPATKFLAERRLAIDSTATPCAAKRRREAEADQEQEEELPEDETE